LLTSRTLLSSRRLSHKRTARGRNKNCPSSPIRGHMKSRDILYPLRMSLRARSLARTPAFLPFLDSFRVICNVCLQILINNKPADFPANTKNLHAFYVRPSAYIKSDYGVNVRCTYKRTMICVIRVSGFYHGKLRGLLGDGNNEFYDDYMLPSGKVNVCSLTKRIVSPRADCQSQIQSHLLHSVDRRAVISKKISV